MHIWPTSCIMKVIAPMLKRYFQLLSGKIIFWNVILLVFIKLVFPYSAFQFASLIDSLPVFNSRDIIAITNEIRSANKLSPLKTNAKLDLAAEEKLNDMAFNEYFAHISPGGVTPWSWIKKAQYKYQVAGENLAIGFTTPKDTLRAWLDSPSHKANLLNPHYQDIGVAVKGVKIGENQGILVVQMFGSLAQIDKPPVGSPVNTTPVPVRTPIPTMVQTQSPTLSPVVSTQTKGEIEIAISPEIKTPEITIQYVSTDIEIPAVEKPLLFKFRDAEKTQSWINVLNSTFTVYVLTLAFLSIITCLLIEKNRYAALRMSLHITILIMATLLPTIKLTFKALIF